VDKEQASTLFCLTMPQRGNAEKPCESKVEAQLSENQSSKYFNHLSFKTSTLQNIYNNAHAEKEAHKEYMNEYQVMLFDFMNSLPLADNLKDELHKVVLATQVQNAPDFIKVKNVLFKIVMDIKEGVLTVTSTLRAVFAGAYNKAVERSSVKLRKSSSIEETANRERPVPFYNWLNERANRSEICSRPNLEN
jgi:hypothetical protein